MASIFIKDRIDVNHMDVGAPVKDAEDLTIEDYVPTQVEKDYVFQSLVCYFAYRLVTRFPKSFKSIKGCIEPNKPHQFQTEMNSKSEEFTGKLYTKSEAKTEDLIEMMTEIQSSYVHKFKDQNRTMKCYEKKILSGDNKTEKNQTYGILRFSVGGCGSGVGGCGGSVPGIDGSDGGCGDGVGECDGSVGWYGGSGIGWCGTLQGPI